MFFRKAVLSLLFVSLLLFAVAPVNSAGLGDAGSMVSGIAGQAGATTYSKPQDLVGKLINAALSMVGLIFLVLMIYAGYLWLTSHGEDEPIKKAQKIIVSSVIGFILVASAYAITVFVGKRFETGGSGGSDTKECTPKTSGWSCQDIDICLKTNEKDEMYDEKDNLTNKRSMCEINESFCKLGLCPKDPDGIVCCADSSGAGAGGDPNLQGCCHVCETTSFFDTGGCDYKSEADLKPTSQSACNVLINKCDETKDCKALFLTQTCAEVVALVEKNDLVIDCNQKYMTTEEFEEECKEEE